MFLLLLSLAHAQVDEMMSIESERDVAAARSALDETIRDLGYVRVDIGARSQYIHPRIWKPRVTVYDDGLSEVRARRAAPLMLVPAGTVSRFTDEQVRSLSVSDYLSNEQDNAAGVSGLWTTRRSRARMEGDILAEISDELQAWQEALWVRNRLLRDEEIRQRLYTAWEDPTHTPAARRHEVLEMWLNTTDNSDGERVREMIEIFIDDVIQASPAPLTAAEIERANAQHPSERVLEPVAPRRPGA